LPNLRAVVFDPRGVVYAHTYSGIFRIAGGRAQPIGDYRSAGSVDHLVAGPDGHLWGTSYQGVVHYDRQRWERFPKAELGPAITLLRDVAVDARGRVWVASTDAVHLREGGAWRAANLRGIAPAKPFFERLAVGPSGDLYVSSMGGILRYHEGRWSKV